MQVTDGSDIQTNLLRDCDVAIVGSGPAGATVARRLAGEGADVVVVEEGPYIEPEDFPADTFTAFTEMYRDMGSQLTANFPPIPVLQGRVVGGSSVNNGAICWQFPREVYERWCEDDRELEEALPWEVLKEHETQIEEDLKVAPTADAIAGPNNTLMGEGAEELGLEHRPIRRNVDGDCGRGRCMQGCPEGKKMSMDRSYLPDAVDRGAEILSSVRVDRIDLADGRARAIEGAARGGGRVRVRADRAVVLAASAIQTPALLLRNGIDHGPVGDHLQAHPGTAIEARFPQAVRMWTGATQGHEVTEFCDDGLKIETLGYGPAFAATKTDAVGTRLAEDITDLEHWANWAVEIAADAHGSVRSAGPADTRIEYELTDDDMRKIRRGVAIMSELFLAAGADFIAPGVHGWTDRIESPEDLEGFEEEGPLERAHYDFIVSHMFGTCRMGSDPEDNVVRPDFRHHEVDQLYVADSSVFPTNLGVNPQISIMTMAARCADRILQGTGNEE